MNKAFFAFSLPTLASRVLGFVRDVLIARVFGSDALLEAFLVAFKIPNFFRRLFAEGAFSQAFIPMLARVKAEDAKNNASHPPGQAWVRFIAARLMLVLAILTVAVWALAPIMIDIFAPGFEDTQRDTAAALLRITFPYLLCVSWVALASAVLQSEGHYAMPASAPILLNVCFIAAIGWGHAYVAIPVFALAWAVCAAGVLQVLFLAWPFARAGFLAWPQWENPRLAAHARTFWRTILPLLVGASVVQINLLVDMVLASTLPTGSIAWLYYAQRLLELPNGLVIVALSVIALNKLSQCVSTDDVSGYREHLSWSLSLGMYLTIPAMVGLLVLHEEVVLALFTHGVFSENDRLQTAGALWMYALAIPAYMFLKILTSVAYAHLETRAVLRMAVVVVAVNIALNILLMQFLAHMGLALATTLSVWLNVLMLALYAKRRAWLTTISPWWCARVILSALLMGALLALFTPPMVIWQGLGAAGQFALLLGIITGGLALYFSFNRLFKLPFPKRRAA